jgi:hypothetical protein
MSVELETWIWIEATHRSTKRSSLYIQASAANKLNIGGFLGFRSDAVSLFLLLRYGVASVHDWCLAFGDCLVVCFIGLTLPEYDTTMLSRNVSQ